MKDLQTVAVGFDGSTDSAMAVRWAAALSKMIGATLRVIHVVGLLEEQHVGGKTSVARETAVRIAKGAGLSAERVEWVQLTGSPSEALLRATEPSHSVGLLVVGSRGSGRVTGMLLGSTSLDVAEHSRIPVAIVPNDD